MSRRISLEEHLLQGGTNLSRAMKYPAPKAASTCVAGRPEVPDELSAAEKSCVQIDSGPTGAARLLDSG